ncbi:hypothetical protein [Salipiger thiooxidans]|uniref:hypothetical protein n=1 Tax=Salipiger thiooxidans TaxID=282683 RepID=UPI001CFA04DA|nr:hypothetical protein [Salipiger thiooxidans]
MAARYYSPDDPESYVTPSRLKRLGRKKQVEHMVHWFHGMFEDPQNEMPYADKEDPGDSPYRYPWGGPYDANEQLQDEFSDVVPFDVIQEAVQEVQSDGTLEWAPGPRHPDQIAANEDAMAERYEAPPPPTLEDIQARLESGVRPSFGDDFERQERAALRHELAELRGLLAAELSQHGGMGHNHPPDHLSLTPELNSEATDAIDKMDAELAKDAPDIAVVAESAGTLKKVLGWIAGKLDKSVDGFMTTIGTAAAGAVVAELAGFPVAERLGSVYHATLTWLDSVTLPF